MRHLNSATTDEEIEGALRYQCGEPSTSIALAMHRSKRCVLRMLERRNIQKREGRNSGNRLYDRESRFWSRVAKTSADICWLWMGPIEKTTGYGNIRSQGTQGAHRLAYFYSRGHLPSKGQVVRHTCDNRLCCNPDHLLEGTHGDNMADAAERFRMEHGTMRYNAKLNEDAVRDIRSRYALAGLSALAREYGVDKKTVLQIQNRTRWRHVT